MTNQKTQKMFILVVEEGNGIKKYPEEDDTHYDIFELVNKIAEIDRPFVVRELTYQTLTKEELQAYVAGAEQLQPLVTLH